jgi:hypothetical protein
VAGSPGVTENKKADWATTMEIAWRMWRGKGLITTEEKEAREMAINLCRGLMDCELKPSMG